MRAAASGGNIAGMAASIRHAMPAADAAWLHMDRPTNPMVVNSLSVLGGVPAYETVVELLRERLVDRFPRFRRRLVDPRGPAAGVRGRSETSTSRITCTGGRCLHRGTRRPWRAWSATWSAHRSTPTGRSGRLI
jgi:hypothetical protein